MLLALGDSRRIDLITLPVFEDSAFVFKDFLYWRLKHLQFLWVFYARVLRAFFFFHLGHCSLKNGFLLLAFTSFPNKDSHIPYGSMDMSQPVHDKGVPLLPFARLLTSLNGDIKHLSSFLMTSIKSNAEGPNICNVLCALLLSPSLPFPYCVMVRLT